MGRQLTSEARVQEKVLVWGMGERQLTSEARVQEKVLVWGMGEHQLTSEARAIVLSHSISVTLSLRRTSGVIACIDPLIGWIDTCYDS